MVVCQVQLPNPDQLGWTWQPPGGSHTQWFTPVMADDESQISNSSLFLDFITNKYGRTEKEEEEKLGLNSAKLCHPVNLKFI